LGPQQQQQQDTDGLDLQQQQPQQQQQQAQPGSGSGRSVSFSAPPAVTQKPSVPLAPQQQQQKRGRLPPSGPPVHHSDSFLVDAHSSPSDIYARCVQLLA
jgi:hypothetical protein